MAVWAIGDIQGCDDELAALLDAIRFDPAADRLWFCGDLVNRGGQSLEVLRRVRALGDAAVVVLGNHDLSLLAIALRKNGDRRRSPDDLVRVLDAEDSPELLAWLRGRKLVHVDRDLGWMMVHAGLDPRWSGARAEALGREVETRLQGKGHKGLLSQMFGNKPPAWADALKGIPRLRAIINICTRLRYCDTKGRIAFGEKGAPGTQQPGLYPWYEVPGQVKRKLRIVCGHWSTLGLFQGLGVYCIDTGCVWGGRLTALRLDDPSNTPQIVSVAAGPHRCKPSA
ncbi:MAG TPA: symmetrical bis(5'-nucleosyl)-tetraphosphatase [Xanthomonadaceae bacterium]|nr:symmetrical bis(5'-nucleosyl)-tetraphosphatase [Xanthomonadaceae bacterium]